MKKVLLVVLDGWGLSKDRQGNAILSATTKNLDRFWKKYPHMELNASGQSVGLIKGNDGNSEVGHLHLGAGRLVKQDLAKIFDSIKNKSFFKNKILVEAMSQAKEGNLHLLGLLSDGGVHSHIGHLFALLDMAKKFHIKNIYVHAFLDGRDTPPKSAKDYIIRLEKKLRILDPHWKIATIIGRFYAMDRDNRWNREHKAYDALVNCNGFHYKDALTALKAAYKRGETDEFVQPSIVGGPACNVRAGDTVIFFNFRSDRARELTRAFVQGRFNRFKRRKLFKLNFVCLTQYDPEIKAPVAFPPEYISNTLGEVISKSGLRQFRLAETEKWAHVTFFFNGLSGRIFKEEDRLLIPSPKVSTYDKRPEMSAYKITEKAIRKINSGKYSFILINYANADMVGHTGNFKQTVKAINSLDKCLGKLVHVSLCKDFDCIVTADHGNAEQMKYPNGGVCTSHSGNKVPLILISNHNYTLKEVKDASLYNVAPTILSLMKIKKPKEMKAKSLIA